MHKQMMAFIPNGEKAHLTEIFGYSTKGIPGLDIVGLGSKGKSIKEKFIYLNKRYRLKIPPRRFVLCVDDQFVLSTRDELHRWLELPFLIMYWSMAGILPIQNLTDCACGGQISARGKIISSPLDKMRDETYESFSLNNLKLITSDKFKSDIPLPIIPLEEIIVLPDIVA